MLNLCSYLCFQSTGLYECVTTKHKRKKKDKVDSRKRKNLNLRHRVVKYPFGLIGSWVCGVRIGEGCILTEQFDMPWTDLIVIAGNLSTSMHPPHWQSAVQLIQSKFKVLGTQFTFSNVGQSVETHYFSSNISNISFTLFPHWLSSAFISQQFPKTPENPWIQKG